MSELGDLENAIVSRLQAATVSGSPVFEVVRGVSGGYRGAIRDALRRERMPAAYVAFTEEPKAPEVRAAVRGAKFVVLVADQTLRAESDPRHGDVSTVGTFTLLDEAAEQLDDYEPSTGLRLVDVHRRFVEADDRLAVYELLYRVWPVVDPALLPGAPSSLKAYTGQTSGEVRLTWRIAAASGSNGNPDYYRVYRKTSSNQGFILHETAAKDAEEIVLSDQPVGVTLQYCVSAANTGGEGEMSNTVVLVL